MNLPASHDSGAERAVLAACLAADYARSEAKRHITAADFCEPKHEIIWNAMSMLDRAGKHVDPQTLLAALGTQRPAIDLLPELVTMPVFAEHVADYAAIVRSWAVRRRLYSEAMRTQQEALNPDANAQSLAATIATRYAAIRDSGIVEDVTAVTLDELLAEPDDEPDWLIPALVERGDRLMLTGEEGLGKSHLLRQMAVMAGHGMDPFCYDQRIRPIRATIVDCENSRRQVKRRVRAVVEFARHYGAPAYQPVNFVGSSRIDITRDRDLARIHRELDATQPELVVIGPLYKLAPRALQTDDEAAPVLAALDSIRERGCALLIEAHAGHSIGGGGKRDLRPRGSSALLGWPEFGYGMRRTERGADLIPWRGDRDERDWPRHLRECERRIRWIPDEAVVVTQAWGAS